MLFLIGLGLEVYESFSVRQMLTDCTDNGSCAISVDGVPSRTFLSLARSVYYRNKIKYNRVLSAVAFLGPTIRSTSPWSKKS
jgi:hypothetical protein